MDFWKTILSKLQENKRVYLLCVIDSKGSSPGRIGFKMMVTNDGFLFGSIGGGLMEHNLVEEAKQLLQKGDESILFKQQVHSKNAEENSGLLCSGEQTIVFHPLNSKHINDIQRIIECLIQNNKGSLILSPTLFKFSSELTDTQFISKIENSEKWIYKEQIAYKNTLYIIGGGHVGFACSKLFHSLDFHIIVFDNRANLNTFDANIYAHEKHIIDYAHIQEYINKKNSYIAIMTSKYTDDKMILSKLLRNNYKFIGLLSSKSKLKKLYQNLESEGFTKNELEKVYAPIGIPIHSQTPDEIAVSIAAQIIKLKSS